MPALGLIVLLCPGGSSQSVGTATIAAGFFDSLVRANRTENVPTTPSLSLFASRGEAESFQVQVETKTAAYVQITFADLRSGDQVIAHSNFEAFREHFVDISRGSRDLGGTNRPLGPGQYPDPLVPVALDDPKNAQPEKRVVFWVDLFVPRESRPGAYQGEVIVSAASGRVAIPVRVVVWRQILPIRASLQTSFGMKTQQVRNGALAELLLKHRLTPFLVEPRQAATYSTAFGLSLTGLWFFSGSNARACTMDPPPSVPAIREAMAKYPADIQKYVYAADEIDDCPSLFPVLRAWARNVHAAGAKVLATVSPVRDLMDDGSGTGRSAVDIWVMLPKMYDQSRQMVPEVMRKGDQVWSYNALVQDDYSPKWQIDFEPINYRIQAGFLSASLGLSGLLYSEVDTWKGDPWRAGASFTLGGFTFTGEDLLAYPGEPVGAPAPVPSMRLKWLRDGEEDFEYVEMLKRRGRGEWAKNVIHDAAVDWRTWTRDPGTLERVRRTLGEELDKLENTTNK